MENQVIFVWRGLSVPGLMLVTQNTSTKSSRSPLRVSLLRLSCISSTAALRLVPFVSCRWWSHSYVKWRVRRTSTMNDPCWCTLKTRPPIAVLVAIYACASAVYRQPSGGGWGHALATHKSASDVLFDQQHTAQAMVTLHQPSWPKSFAKSCIFLRPSWLTDGLHVASESVMSFCNHNTTLVSRAVVTSSQWWLLGNGKDFSASTNSSLIKSVTIKTIP